MQPHDTEHRLIDLEIKTSLADELLDTLNQTVFRQQQQINSLLRQVAALGQQLNEAHSGLSASLPTSLPTTAPDSAPDSAHELPPHY